MIRPILLLSVCAVFFGAPAASVTPPDAPYAVTPSLDWMPPAWRLTPEAQKLVSQWNARAYTPKQGRTDFIIRAQLKYGINRDDFLHNWYDRPLLQDSSLGQRIDSPTEKKPWLNAEGWRRTVAMARLGKLDALGVFTATSNRDTVIPLSQRPESAMTILVELAGGYNMDEAIFRAEQALAMTNSYRLGGKVVLTRYPTIRESELPYFAALKQKLREKHGDKFLIMPYCSLVDKGDYTEFSVKELEEMRARLRRYLDVLDGLCQASRDSYTNRRYNPWFCRNVLMPVVRSVFTEAQYKDKYLAWWATPGHENSYRWNYGLDCTGTRMLRDTLEDIAALRPDFFVGAEWDEENENTCFRPMVAHGFTHQRVLRYFHDRVNNGGRFDPFPGDDVTVPNLVVSYRKEVMAGEPLEVEVVNIPDGTFDAADITVAFAWKRADGTVVRAFEPRRLKGGELMAAWFREDVSKLVAEPTLVPELTVWSKGEKRVYSEGLWPVGLHTMRCIEYKWAKQPLRDLPKGVVGSVTATKNAVGGTYTVRGTVKSARRLRSIAVLDETDTVYMYEGQSTRDTDTVRVRIAYQAVAANGKKPTLKGAIRLDHAPGAQLRLVRSRGEIAVNGNAFHFTGAMYNNWMHQLLAEVPVTETAGAVFAIDLPGYFMGTVALKDLIEKEVIAFAGPKGGNLVFTLFRSQARIPDPQFVTAADFTFALKPGLDNSILRLETIDEDYHVWRSAPFVFGGKSGTNVTYHVYERDQERRSAVMVDAARLETIDFTFEPSRGAVIAGRSPRNHWGLLGGRATLVSGFGTGESAYGNTAEKFLPNLTGNYSTAPTYTREDDGTYALQFEKGTYVALAQQLWPAQAGFALALEVCPKEVASKQGLIAADAHGTSIWIEEGRVKARFFQRNRFIRVSGRAARVELEGPAIVPGAWQTVRLVCDQQTAYLEVNDARGPSVPVCGDIFYPTYTSLGLIEKGAQFTGRMKTLRIMPR